MLGRFAAHSAVRSIPQVKLDALGRQLDTAYQTMAAHLATNTAVRIERTGGRARLVLTPFDKLYDPPSLLALLNDEDLARLSPLGTNHINVLGRYHFSLPDAIARGEFRPLRESTDFDDQDL
jgi:hypothetical protein